MEKDKFAVTFYTKGGKSPVIKFLSEMNDDTRIKAFEYIEKLEQHGNMLREPFSKKIANIKGLFELCVEYNNNEYRFFYFFKPGRKAVIVHAIQKKRQKTDVGELNTAVERMKELQKQERGERK